MTVIGIIGAGEVGSQIARAAVRNGYEIVIANSRGPETLTDLVEELGPRARAESATGAAEAGDFVVVAVPLKLVNDMPVDQLEGKIALDTNNYMPIRDGPYPVIDSREKTEHELRQEQLPASKIAKAFTHIQAPRLLISGRPAGDPDRPALSVSSDFPEAVALVARLYDQFGFDTVDNSPLSESWRSGPGQPARAHSPPPRDLCPRNAVGHHGHHRGSPRDVTVSDGQALATRLTRLLLARGGSRARPTIATLVGPLLVYGFGAASLVGGCRGGLSTGSDRGIRGRR